MDSKFTNFQEKRMHIFGELVKRYWNGELNDIEDLNQLSYMILDEISTKKSIDYNFIEGMGCNGGCVGGPRTNIEVGKATKLVNEFGEDSLIMTPFDNFNVMKILKQLGIDSIEQIIKNEEVFNLLTKES
ncbi:[Fe-Fe] hydrogenase large subunit C-terminal domain-containing protein [Petroclostridium sp. X23]|uniref:[Fe-Fe] hydrogenase large subunit C-terminal domain-containing protein n=1 Tax=Petroclostridium sp. X23 TaxID=3045146 RepID=UPI0024ACE04A|nr:[Fe-Fe] hydrogenase large subunit C-terminal domain-containing protein [Petroclostridium sp. X23]WHH59246.1 [Fe-Fe] hydrogenase large subunit C-terminal domain-containing protein [Petroclostridium sp. X23]